MDQPRRRRLKKKKKKHLRIQHLDWVTQAVEENDFPDYKNPIRRLARLEFRRWIREISLNAVYYRKVLKDVKPFIKF
jgi:hypothetical protein